MVAPLPGAPQAFIREVLQEHRSTTEAVQYMLAYQCHGPDMEDPDTRGTGVRGCTPGANAHVHSIYSHR